MFVPDLVVRSQRVVLHDATAPRSIHIRQGKIIGVVGFDDVPSGCRLDDAEEAAVLPGLIDAHVDVGAGHVADGHAFEAATTSAASGGVTTIIDLAGGDRSGATTVTALEAKRAAAAGHCFVDVGFWGPLASGHSPDVRPLFDAGVFGFACALTSEAGLSPMSETDLRIVMPGLARIGTRLLVDGRGAEEDAVNLLSRLCREYRTPTHLVHLSSSPALTPLFFARRDHFPLSADTSPGSLCSVPSEQAREYREFLWAALANGLIQFVASGPAPAKGGARQLSLPDVWREARPRGYSLNQIAGWLGRAPAQFLGLTRKGSIDVGYDADLVVFDDESACVRRTYLHGRHIYEIGSAAPPSPPTGNFLMRRTKT